MPPPSPPTRTSRTSPRGSVLSGATSRSIIEEVQRHCQPASREMATSASERGGGEAGPHSLRESRSQVSQRCSHRRKTADRQYRRSASPRTSTFVPRDRRSVRSGQPPGEEALRSAPHGSRAAMVILRFCTKEPKHRSWTPHGGRSHSGVPASDPTASARAPPWDAPVVGPRGACVSLIQSPNRCHARRFPAPRRAELVPH